MVVVTSAGLKANRSTFNKLEVENSFSTPALFASNLNMVMFAMPAVHLICGVVDTSGEDEPELAKPVDERFVDAKFVVKLSVLTPNETVDTEEEGAIPVFLQP
jgi:hypothetical protein